MMLAFLKILRPLNGLMAAFAVLVSAFIVNFPFNYTLLLACIVVFLISSGGMVINDYFDYEIDRINKPHRALPSKKISRDIALIYSIALFLVGNILALTLNQTLFLIAILNTFLLVLYSWKLKKKLLIGNFVISWLTASTLLFGSLLKGILTAIILILFMMIFFTNIGREIVKSIEDVKGDLKLKAKTLPIVFGEKFAGWMAALFIFFGILLSPLPYALGLLNVYYTILVVFADIAFAFSCFTLFISPKRSQKIMKFAMLLGLLAFLFGAF